jgi:polysaccharide pyruvyl transferase WcaK-like protein
MFPFHSGSLSNSDDEECRAIISCMKRGEDAELAGTGSLEGFMQAMSQCRIFVTVPLHGSILSVVTGALPVALPYASKGFRFMEDAGLGELCVASGPGDWTGAIRDAIGKAWDHTDFVWKRLSGERDRLIRSSRLNRDHFRATCLG